jgi:hypothetical protein
MPQCPGGDEMLTRTRPEASNQTLEPSKFSSLITNIIVHLA